MSPRTRFWKTGVEPNAYQDYVTATRIDYNLLLRWFEVNVAFVHTQVLGQWPRPPPAPAHPTSLTSSLSNSNAMTIEQKRSPSFCFRGKVGKGKIATVESKSDPPHARLLPTLLYAAWVSERERDRDRETERSKQRRKLSLP